MLSVMVKVDNSNKKFTEVFHRPMVTVHYDTGHIDISHESLESAHDWLIRDGYKTSVSACVGKDEGTVYLYTKSGPMVLLTIPSHSG